MTAIIILVAGYFALLFALSLLVRGRRERLIALSHDLLCQKLQPHQEETIKRLMESAYAQRSAPMQFLVTVAALLTPSETIDRDARAWAINNTEIVSDKRWGELFDCYSASISAANPIFGALAALARVLFVFKARLFLRKHYGPSRPSLDTKALELFGELRAI